MTPVATSDFLLWARTCGIAPDDRYDEPRCLVYLPYRDYDRFWVVPKSPEAIPYFAEQLLAGLGDWATCYLWLREGQWPSARHSNSSNDVVRDLIFRAAQVPDGFEGALQFSKSEQGKILGIISAVLMYGWSAGEDLFVIPNHGKVFLQTDHHGVVHVNCADANLPATFVAHMAENGFAE